MTGKIIADRLIPLLGYIAQQIPLSLPCVLSEVRRIALSLPSVIPCSDLITMRVYLNQLKTG